MVRPPTNAAAVGYHVTVREMPHDERPRERLARYGPATLQTAELLALILRTGTEQENVVELAMKLLTRYGGLTGLWRADFAELCQEHGLGPAKVAQLKAALELGRRLAVSSPDDRPRISSPADVYTLLGIEMSALAQEQLRVLLLDTKNAVVHIAHVYQGTPFHMPLQEHRNIEKRWAQKYDSCNYCGTTNARHHSNGLCERCVRRKNAGHLPPGSWSLSYSACQVCGTTVSSHKARGVCNRCYLLQRRSPKSIIG